MGRAVQARWEARRAARATRRTLGAARAAEAVKAVQRRAKTRRARGARARLGARAGARGGDGRGRPADPPGQCMRALVRTGGSLGLAGPDAGGGSRNVTCPIPTLSHWNASLPGPAAVSYRAAARRLSESLGNGISRCYEEAVAAVAHLVLRPQSGRLVHHHIIIMPSSRLVHGNETMVLARHRGGTPPRATASCDYLHP